MAYGKEHYNDGQLSYIGNYKNGKKHGKWCEYWSNGKKLFNGNYNMGEQCGYWEFFNTSEQICLIEFYAR